MTFELRIYGPLCKLPTMDTPEECWNTQNSFLSMIGTWKDRELVDMHMTGPIFLFATSLALFRHRGSMHYFILEPGSIHISPISLYAPYCTSKDTARRRKISDFKKDFEVLPKYVCIKEAHGMHIHMKKMKKRDFFFIANAINHGTFSPYFIKNIYSVRTIFSQRGNCDACTGNITKAIDESIH